MSGEMNFVPINLDGVTDNITIEYKGSPKLLQLGSAVLTTLAETNLRVSVIEVNAGIEGATDDFEDIFSDANGLLDTVDLDDTTAFYQSETYLNASIGAVEKIESFSTTYYNDDYKTGHKIKKACILESFSIESDDSTSGTFDIKVNGIVKKSIPSASYSRGVVYNFPDINIKLNPNDELVFASGSTGFRIFATSNIAPTTNDYITSMSGFNPLYKESGTFFNFKSIDVETPANTDIVLNYDKGKPTGVYLHIWSGNTSIEDIGTCTFQLEHIASGEITSEITPFTPTSISMVNTPDRLIIHQKDGEISKISKFVLLVQI